MIRAAILTSIILLTSCVTFSQKSLYEFQDDMRDRLLESVVRLESPRGGWGTAYAMVYKGKNVLVTNSHVCGSETFMFSKHETLPVRMHKVMRHSIDNDLCMLEGRSDLKPLQFADRIESNETVFSVGYPLHGYPVLIDGRIKGTIEVKTTWREDCRESKYLSKQYSPRHGAHVCVFSADMDFTTMSTDGGASGSPIVNSEGKLVGTVSMIHGANAWVISVPQEDIRKFIED